MWIKMFNGSNLASVVLGLEFSFAFIRQLFCIGFFPFVS